MAYSDYCWKENYKNLVSQNRSEEEFSLTFKKQHFGETRLDLRRTCEQSQIEFFLLLPSLIMSSSAKLKAGRQPLSFL